MIRKTFKLKKDNNTLVRKCYCRTPELIENYEAAVADTTQTWQCHHRLETHNSDGERRLVDISRAELIALGMYFDRPPEELVFLTELEHKRLHNVGKHVEKQLSEEARRKMSEAQKGKRLSEETKRKISEALKGKKRTKEWKINHSAAVKGENNPMYGKHRSEEVRRKISEAHKGKHVSEETRRKISETMKGKKLGLCSEETKKKMRQSMKGQHKGKHWFNNGEICTRCFDCPEGFVPGILRK